MAGEHPIRNQGGAASSTPSVTGATLAHMHAAVATPSSLWKRVAPVACGCALAGAAALVALNDPAKAGSGFPACQFRAATGLWCPGCGLTRGFHQLFNGNLLSAVQHNLFVPLVLVAVAVSWWSWLRSSWGRAPVQLPAAVARWVRPGAVSLIVAVVLYGVLRNLPVAPFDALAP